MEKNEYQEYMEQLMQAAGEGNFERAAMIADRLPWERCSNAETLCKVAYIYERTGQYEKSQKLLFIAYNLDETSKNIVFRLGLLAVKMGKYTEAENCCREFISLAPKDPNRYILEYRILQARRAPIQEQIAVLEAFKSAEYLEEWGYELALLYHEAGMDMECVEECDDLILWFSESEYAYKAMELKSQYKPLSDMQIERYSNKFGDTGSLTGTYSGNSAMADLTEEEDQDDVSQNDKTSEYVKEEEPGEALDESLAEREEAAEEYVAEQENNLEESEVGISDEQKLADSLKIDEILNEWDQKQSILDAPEEEETEPEEISTPESALDSILSDEVKQLMAELEAGLDSAVISGEISLSEEEKKIEEEKKAQEAARTAASSVPKREAAFTPEEPEKVDDTEEPADEEDSEPEESASDEAVLSSEPLPELSEEDSVPEVATILDEPAKKKPKKPAPKKTKVDKIDEPTIPIKKPVPQDTGFIIEARYDLDATSEIGTKVGLNEEQTKIFSYFVPVRGMSEQIVEVLNHDKYCRGRAGSSRTGNILVIGHKGSGKTVLAVDLIKAIQKQRQTKGGKVAIVNAVSLNKKNISDIFLKLKRGALIIEEAGKLHPRTVEELNVEMEKQTGELLVILEEEREPLKSLLRSNVRFAKKFTAKLEVPVFTNDELVTFAQTYAKENGYKLDDLAILALYSRIDAMQKESHSVSITEVKEVLDEAMNHSKKAMAKKFMKRLRGKSEDEEGRIILNEHDFV